ncbi:MAG: site-specific integrase, partial [Clostridia bacterium]|nr:site-specific integrase [Clostridia bacterium]
MKYKDWLNEWLDNYIEPTAKSRTFSRYSEIVKQHIIPKLGEYDLSELTPNILQSYVTELLRTGNLKTGKGLAVNSVNSIVNVIQNSLHTAFRLGYIKEYTADRIKRPKPQEKDISCFSAQEQKTIEQAVLNGKKNKMFGVMLCLYSGLRVGELLALKWEDIDFQAGILTVSKSCHDGKGKDGHYIRVEETPKTSSSRRVIPLPKQLFPLIKEAKKKSTSEYIVAKDNKPLSVRSYQRSFALLQRKLKIPHRGFHSLRHTFATRALECGMDVKTLSEILGHKSPTVTLNRYVHSFMEHKKEMMNRLGKLI